MAEPTTTGGATWSFASWVAVFFGAQLPFINPHTLIGAVGGALVYLVFDQAWSAWKRSVGAFVSVACGYVFEPEIMMRLGIQQHGIGAFIVSSLLILTTLFVMGLIRSGRIMDIFSKGKSS